MLVGVSGPLPPSRSLPAGTRRGNSCLDDAIMPVLWAIDWSLLPKSGRTMARRQRECYIQYYVHYSSRATKAGVHVNHKAMASFSDGVIVRHHPY
jgi:hypothetical protein